jgi:hypothetical protein
VDNYTEMIEYQNNHKRLGYETLTTEEIMEAEKSLNMVIEKYGEVFTKHYGWVGDYLPKDKRTFAGIEENIEFKFLRPFYKAACNYIHSGSRGLLFKLGVYNQYEVLLTGPSNYGFADPGRNTAYSLFQTTLTLTEFESYLEDALYVQVGRRMLDRVINKFEEIQEHIEIEENGYQSDQQNHEE